ncbi:MAG: hypothetical protein IJM35_10015 [Bacteroidales bacterium]|nr:hypothetical protein [Bacteroidales bacterium]
MNKIFPAAILVGAAILLPLSSCNRKKHKGIEPPRQTPSFTVRIGNDSIHVDGATFYSAPFVLPLVLKPYNGPESDFERGASGQNEVLANPRWVCLKFAYKVNSFDIHVVLHFSDNIDSQGIAEWTFTKGQNSICIDTDYSWNWREEVDDQGEIFSISPSPEMVQGQDSIIHDTPFCFKDIDFDGKAELCFRTPGWNRYYFNAFKIVSSTSAKLMTGHPYNNLVYSDEEACSAVFDYARKTIHLVEVYGSSVYDHWYKKRAVVHDVLNPMQHTTGVESNYSGGCRDDDYFENGKWVKAHKEYIPDIMDGYAYTVIVADYVALKGANLSLQTLKLHDLDNEVWKDLYNNSLQDP